MVLFNSSAEANRAMNEMQGKFIGPRYVQLFQVSFGEYNDFKGAPVPHPSTNKLASYITSSNKQRALVMRGLPFKVSVAQI